MPGQDGTGPLGQGPLTGRGLGPCGRGLGFRKGFGRGSGRSFGRGLGIGTAMPVILTKEQEKKILEAELKEIETEKAEVEKQLKELK